jgi:lysophospholipase L1-like esterase
LRVAAFSALTAALLLIAACGGDDDGGATPVPTATSTRTAAPATSAAPATAATPSPSAPSTPTPNPLGVAPGEDPPGDQRLYLALGDSLSEGIAASDPKRTAWVPLVAIGLGAEYELLNLGVAGHDSEELIEEGPLDRALGEIAARASDATPNNELAIVTLEIGGNDLLDLYDSLVLTGDCPSVGEALQRQECVDGLRGALDEFGPNLGATLDALAAAAPGVPIYLMTLYNPFSGGAPVLDQIGALALEGQAGTPFPEGLNDIIRQRAAAHAGVVLVEWYELFLGQQRNYISQDLIHPNDTGYRVMADAVLAAIRGQ